MKKDIKLFIYFQLFSSSTKVMILIEDYWNCFWFLYSCYVSVYIKNSGFQNDSAEKRIGNSTLIWFERHLFYELSGLFMCLLHATCSE